MGGKTPPARTVPHFLLSWLAPDPKCDGTARREVVELVGSCSGPKEAARKLLTAAHASWVGRVWDVGEVWTVSCSRVVLVAGSGVGDGIRHLTTCLDVTCMNVTCLYFVPYSACCSPFPPCAGT